MCRIDTLKKDVKAKTPSDEKTEDFFDNNRIDPSPLNKELMKGLEDLLEKEANPGSNIPSPLNYEAIQNEPSVDEPEESFVIISQTEITNDNTLQTNSQVFSTNHQNDESKADSFNQEVINDQVDNLSNPSAASSNSSFEIDEALTRYNSTIPEGSTISDDTENNEEMISNEKNPNESLNNDTILVPKTPDELFVRNRLTF